ncbi:MAG TPA: hypothetical protein VN814_09005 [Caulobacteraceae bacterium]|nr:hypothetical protein [Caulobacteraceae bacterium]
MRRLLITASLLLLGACNMVVTQDPLFTKADASLQLREGVWLEPSDGPCDFDQSKPLAQWPSCAKGVIVSKGQIGAWDTDDKGVKTWKSSDVIFTAGQPPVAQVHLADMDVKGVGDVPLKPALYLYLVIKPTKTDDSGQIIAYTGWPILCGPPPPDGAKGPDGSSPRMGTLQPLPGLTMDKEGNNCTTASRDALRAAGVASEKWAQTGSMTVTHWVRDNDR